MPKPVTSVFDLQTGDRVTLVCQTSDKNIFLKAPTDDGRRRYSPEPCLLKPIRYTLQGIVVGINTEGTYPYLVLSLRGECSVISPVRDINKVTGTEVREKISHVPISAIVKLLMN